MNVLRMSAALSGLAIRRQIWLLAGLSIVALASLEAFDWMDGGGFSHVSGRLATVALVSAAILFLCWRLELGIMRPLARIEEAAGRWSGGDFAFRATTGGAGEMSLLVGRLNAMAIELERMCEDQATIADALRASEVRLQVALESGAVAIWDTDLRTGECWLSDAWAAMRGAEPGPTRMTIPQLTAITHPDDLDEIVRASRDVIVGLRSFYLREHRVRDVSGGWRWILSRGRVTARDPNGRATRMSGTNVDITDRKLGEQALRRAEERYRNFIALSGEAIFRLALRDPVAVGESEERLVNAVLDGAVLAESNVAHARLYGFETEQATVGLPMERFGGREVSRRLIDAFVRNGLRLDHAEWSEGAGESERWFRGSLLGTVSEGRLVDIWGTRAEVTAAKRQERELVTAKAALEERVAERTRELLDANRELEAFAYTVSHDLRAPLRFMGGCARLIEGALDEGSPERARELLRGIDDGANRMLRLIEGLLEFSRLGRHPIERREIDLRALVHEVVGELAPGDCELSVGELPAVSADPMLARQVIANLISNAAKYSAPRERPRIEVGSETQEGEAVIYVRDNGVGFSMRHASRLFEAFQRLHPESQFPGVGVGLAIVKRIVERHGGRVWAEAKAGEGATFRFTLGAASA